MKVYVAAPFGRKDEAQQLGDLLENNGIEVTSNWLWTTEEEGEENVAAHGREWAMRDLADIEAAHMLVILTEPRGQVNTNGRMVEMGFALAQGKAVCTIGPKENVFCHLVKNHPTHEDFIEDVTGPLSGLRNAMISMIVEEGWGKYNG